MTRSTIAALILANLACSPATTAAPPPQPQSLDSGKCMTDSDCKPGLSCTMGTDGASTLPPPGTCMVPGPLPGGRPLFVDDVAHVARHTRARTWTATSGEGALVIDPALGARLRDDALAEHASVAAFARTICQLCSLGAPAWLVESTQRALADEIAHARDTFELAARLGVEASPGAFAEAVAPFPGAGDAMDLGTSLLRDVFRGGCVGETLAAFDVAARALDAPLPELHALYSKIAVDEARHAALAYETALWLLQAFPALHQVLVSEKARFLEAATQDERTLLAPLMAWLT